MKFKLTFLTLFLFFYVYSQNKSKDITPESVGISSDSLVKLNKELYYFIDEGKIAGIQTAILKKDKIIHFDSYGYADIKTKQKIDSSSIFRIYSMTKPIVSVALMQLYEQDKFALEDPLHKYVPEFKNMVVASNPGIITKAKKHIKIIDLLRHSSGLGYGRGRNDFINEKYRNSNIWASKNNEEFIKKLSTLPLYFEPGTDWQYGTSTSVIGYLIEVLSGESLENHILKPLQMVDTHFQIPKEKTKHLTTSYSNTNNDGLIVTDLPETSRYIKEVTLYNGGGGLVSTTNDYLNFCKMLLNQGVFNELRILKSSTIDLMTKDHLQDVRKHTKRLRILPGETGFGLGFSIANKTQNKETIIYGWGGALGTYFRIDPENDLAYVLMVQISPYRQLRIREKFQELVQASLID